MRRHHQDEVVAIGRRPRDDLGTNGAVGAGAVLDHHRLAPTVAQLLRKQPRKNIGAAPGGVRHDDAQRLGGKAVGVRDRGQQGQGDSRQADQFFKF